MSQESNVTVTPYYARTTQTRLHNVQMLNSSKRFLLNDAALRELSDYAREVLNDDDNDN